MRWRHGCFCLIKADEASYISAMNWYDPICDADWRRQRSRHHHHRQWWRYTNSLRADFMFEYFYNKFYFDCTSVCVNVKSKSSLITNHMPHARTHVRNSRTAKSTNIKNVHILWISISRDKPIIFLNQNFTLDSWVINWGGSGMTSNEKNEEKWRETNERVHSTHSHIMFIERNK